ncbi:hypothetical protein KY361_05305 [Candidatus Woesearchaeota archaeon]|nr:hypothetical protein [Candidatus Woesearchaeota archaeon]
MVNQEIIDYLKKQKKRGYDDEEIRNMSIRRGYDPGEIDEALDHMNAPEPVKQPEKVEYPEPVPEPKPEPVEEPEPVKENPQEELSPYLEPDPLPKFPIHYTAITSFIVLLVLGGAGFFFFTMPVCGNGAIERGETIETCCLDAGCLGDQICEESGCVDPICGECQYLEAHSCVNYECCDDSACADSMKCENNVCIDITCGECEYAANYTCMKYECCTDEDCNGTEDCVNNKCIIPPECGACQYLENYTCKSYVCCENEYCEDSNPATIDICVNPGTVNASCTNTERPSCQRDEDCDDNNASTMDICMGGTYCSSIPITYCKDNDGYCPESCDYSDDNDCEKERVECSGINCFIEEAEDDCNPANLTYAFTTERDGIIYDTEAYYELRGLEGDDCLFYTFYLDVDLTYSDDLIQTKLAQNMTQQEIDNEIDDLEDDYEDDYEDKDKLCEYPIDDLVDVLRDMRDDDYMVPDDEEDDYDCTGSIY